MFGSERKKREAWAENEVALGVQLIEGRLSITNDELMEAMQHFRAALTVITPSDYPQQAARIQAALDSVQETIARRDRFLDEAARRFGWSPEEVDKARHSRR